MDYIIRNRATDVEHEVAAPTMAFAVIEAVRREYPTLRGNPTLGAARQTGMYEKSGVFAVYKNSADGRAKVGPDAGYHAS